MSNKNKIDNETKEIIDSFIMESSELLDKAEISLLKIDGDANQEIVNTVFRMFHSIKGSAGYLNFNNIKNVTHESEALLDLIRKKEIIPTQEIIETLYKSVDFLRQIIKNVEVELDDEGYESPAQIIINDISKSIQNVNLEIEKKEITEKSIDGEDFIAPFIAESNYIIEEIEKKIVEYQFDGENSSFIDDIFRGIHTIKGNAGFLGFDILENRCFDLESVLDHLRNSSKRLTAQGITSLLKEIDFIKENINFLNVKVDEKDREKIDNDNHHKHNRLLGDILIEIGAATREDIDKALEIQGSSLLGEILVKLGVTTQDKVDEAVEIQKKQKGDTKETQTACVKHQDIRIDSKKLDFLFDAVGEMITTGAMLVNDPDVRALNSDNFNKTANRFNKITREIHEIAMSMRMINLDGLFSKMKRLVWDISKKMNKKINFTVTGEDTEIDRNVIQEISDPLVHILRNAIDHGIENSEKRLESNKTEAGNITLAAKHEGNEIWISVSDDGSGLNKEKILKKAIEKGLISGEDVNMSEQEIYQLILKPGFSTADTVSDISGRGVGMDVVKRNIDNLRGGIEIISVPGKGTEIILKIPLTLAIMDVVSVEVGESVLSIPTIDVLEFLKPDSSKILNTDEDNLIYNLRDEIIPIIRLCDFFKIKTDINNITDGIIIIATNNRQKIALFADKILGSYQIVIKPMFDQFGDVKGIMGTAIMGSGEVSLAIDINGIISNSLWE